MTEVVYKGYLEEEIISKLTNSQLGVFSGYALKDESVYNKNLCLIEEDLIGFLVDTQFTKYKALQEQYGSLTDKKITERIAKCVSVNKTLYAFHNGISDRGQKLDLIYFKPNHDRSPEHWENYNKNRFTLIRQLHYSEKSECVLNVVLFINGLPVVTIEIEDITQGQTLLKIIGKYRTEHDPKEKIFEFQRCLVHFAVGADKIFMTTHLTKESTCFLPFNKDLVNSGDDGFPTAYLWKDVLTSDSLLDLLQNYINLQVNEEKVYDFKTKDIVVKTTETLLFPRFHQRRAINRILNDIREKGTGQKYLIQHSAGSGKSNTIAWLAHYLSDFYQYPSDEKVLFDCTMVVSDRRVLNKQIQNNIRQFEHVKGAVAYIDENKTAQDLKVAIEKGIRIVVTTLQKFPVISETIRRFPDRKYAVIIDEAHSSQTGESARHLRKALSLEQAEQAEGEIRGLDEIILDEIRSKTHQTNVSFFAFTATPKNKTLEMFGTRKEGGKIQPFDLYTMEQAIKEGFVLDVLKNYMSWKRYYKLVKRSNVEDREYEKKTTLRLLSSYIDLQEHAIEKKARIMLEHFVTQTQKEIQGTARAMLVTRSRLHAVRYKRKFDEIMREMNLPYGALVAFSGIVTDEETGIDYTEDNMNNLPGKITIPEALKMPDFRILIVANKYQTGFDEPLLQTMFVDKKLGDTATVQTLCRLNRVKKGKDSTMILDFVNDPAMIQADFQKYYGGNLMELDDQTDPNSLYDVLQKIKSVCIIHSCDAEAFADVFFRQGDRKEEQNQILDTITGRYQALTTEQKQNVKTDIKIFIRLYRFLSQIITFADVGLEKYYVLLVALEKRLPFQKDNIPIEVLEDVELVSFKLQHQYTANLKVKSGDKKIEGRKPGGSRKSKDHEYELLTRIIQTLNENYGLDLREEDRLDFLRIKKNIENNSQLMAYFNPQNTKANIQDKFNDVIDDELLNFVNIKLDLYNKLTEEKVNSMFKSILFNEIYDRLVRGKGVVNG